MVYFNYSSFWDGSVERLFWKLYTLCHYICFGFEWIFVFYPLATEFCFLILKHSVRKMWIIQKPQKVALWNKRHFEEKKTESVQRVLNVSYWYFLNKYIKCKFWRLDKPCAPYSIWDARIQKVNHNNFKL
jgi:hypothetical protein